jgi:hypothetical protein
MVSILCILQLHRWSRWDENGERYCHRHYCIANQER